MHWLLSKWKNTPARNGVQRAARARRAVSVSGNSRRLHRLEILEPRLVLAGGGGGTNGNDTLKATAGSDFLAGFQGNDTYLFDNINSIGV